MVMVVRRVIPALIIAAVILFIASMSTISITPMAQVTLGARIYGEASQYGSIVNITLVFRKPDNEMKSLVITDPSIQDVKVPLGSVLVGFIVNVRLSTSLYPVASDAMQYSKAFYSLTAPDGGVAVGTTQIIYAAYLGSSGGYHYIKYSTGDLASGDINYKLVMPGIYRLTIHYQVWY